MTPEQFALLLTASGGSVAFLGIVQVITKLIDVYAVRRGASDVKSERTDQLDQSNQGRLWERIHQLEVAAASALLRHDQQVRDLSERHDRELGEVRARLDTVSRELGDTRQRAVSIEQERQHALSLYTALLQAHEALKIRHDELQIQVTALRAENTEMRRSLPSGKE